MGKNASGSGERQICSTRSDERRVSLWAWKNRPEKIKRQGNHKTTEEGYLGPAVKPVGLFASIKIVCRAGEKNNAVAVPGKKRYNDYNAITKISEIIDDLQVTTKDRHMNDLKYGRISAFEDVLELLENIK